MLVVIFYLKFWAPELKMYGPFIIWINYKNLEYFIIKRELLE